MNYNNNLQTNNTNLQKVLNLANNLPTNDASGKEVKKWILTMEDGSTIEKYVEVPKQHYIEVKSFYEGDTNGGLIDEYYVYHGQPFVFEIFTHAVGFECLEVRMNNENIRDSVYNAADGLITIPSVTSDVFIVLEENSGWDDDFG